LYSFAVISTFIPGRLRTAEPGIGFRGEYPPETGRNQFMQSALNSSTRRAAEKMRLEV
jgi:hypothetical protein